MESGAILGLQIGGIFPNAPMAGNRGYDITWLTQKIECVPTWHQL